MLSQESFEFDFYGERVELGWGFWYYAEEGPDFWYGPWSGSDWAGYAILGLLALVGALNLWLFLRRTKKGLRRLHAARAATCFALIVMSVCAGNWDKLFLGLPLLAALVLLFDLGVASSKPEDESGVFGSDHGIFGFIVWLPMLLPWLD